MPVAASGFVSSARSPRVGPDGRYVFVVPLPGGGSRISIANAQLRGRRVIQSGNAVDWSS